MKKIRMILMLVLLNMTIFGASLEIASKDFNNDIDGFKNVEIQNLDKNIKKSYRLNEYVLSFDGENSLVKIEEKKESESGDTLIYCRQYYKNDELVYFEYLIDVIPDAECSFVAKSYINKGQIKNYKIYGNSQIKKLKADVIKENLKYPATTWWILNKEKEK